MKFQQVQNNKIVLYSFGCLNPEEGHKVLLKALTLTEQQIKVKMFVHEGYYSFEDMKSFAESIGVLRQVDIQPAKLFDVTTFDSEIILSVVVASLSESSTFPAGLDSWNIPLLVSATEENRKLVIDGVSGLMHSPGNWQQLAKQLNYLYRNSAVAEHLAGKHDFHYSDSKSR